MSHIWKTTGFTADVFVAVDDASALPTGQAVLVSLKRWRTARAELLALEVPVGVVLEPTTDFDPVADALKKLDAIVIPFAKFTDGRGYSLARRLRDEFHFNGEVRASGDVLSDQIPLMLRCGFDAFAITHAPTVHALQLGRLPSVPAVYQTATHGRRRTIVAPHAVLEAAE